MPNMFVNPLCYMLTYWAQTLPAAVLAPGFLIIVLLLFLLLFLLLLLRMLLVSAPTPTATHALAHAPIPSLTSTAIYGNIIEIVI